MVKTTWPSLPMRMKAFGANSSDPAASLRASGRLKLKTSPPPAAALAARKLRRDRLASEAIRSRIMSASLLVRQRGELDRLADANISSAAANVAAHGVVDIGIGRMRVACEKRRGRHDLSGLAVAALDHFMVEPGLLDLRACRCRADPLDGGHLRLADAVNRSDAGTGGDAVDMHSAGAAQRHAASELRPGHAEHIAQDPEQRRIAIHIDAVCGSVDFDGKGHDAVSFCSV